MRQTILFRWATVIALFLFLYFFWTQIECCGKYHSHTKKGFNCEGYKTIQVKSLSSRTRGALLKNFTDKENRENSSELRKGLQSAESDTILTLRVPFVCNQLIYSPGLSQIKENEDKIRQYLKCEGFIRERTCPCSDSLELWKYTGAGDADLIEIVKDPPKDNTGQGIGGLSLNYEIEMEDSLNLATIAFLDTIDKQVPAAKVITIGVSDSGVDLDPGNPFVTNLFLWDKSTDLKPGPCIDPGQYGLSKLTNLVAPNDLIGHGSFINGILIGAAQINNTPQTPAPADINIKILNIKNADGKKLSVFDGICGLFFGVEQGITLFNISWGFLEENSPVVPEIFNVFLRNSPSEVLLVAGTGNKGISLDFDARFWPACLAENESRVISVGACNKAGTDLADFSNFSFSSRMTLIAPGEGIVSLVPKSIQIGSSPSGYSKGSGTSYATPFVTRQVAFWCAQGTPSGDIKFSANSIPAKLLGMPLLEI